MKFVGWDWVSVTHDVTTLDEKGQLLDRWACQHTEQSVAAALCRLGSDLRNLGEDRS